MRFSRSGHREVLAIGAFLVSQSFASQTSTTELPTTTTTTSPTTTTTTTSTTTTTAEPGPGEAKWTLEFNFDLSGTAVSDDSANLYVGLESASQDNLHCVDTATGTLTWSTLTERGQVWRRYTA